MFLHVLCPALAVRQGCNLELDRSGTDVLWTHATLQHHREAPRLLQLQPKSLLVKEIRLGMILAIQKVGGKPVIRAEAHR